MVMPLAVSITKGWVVAWEPGVRLNTCGSSEVPTQAPAQGVAQLARPQGHLLMSWQPLLETLLLQGSPPTRPPNGQRCHQQPTTWTMFRTMLLACQLCALSRGMLAHMQGVGPSGGSGAMGLPAALICMCPCRSMRLTALISQGDPCSPRLSISQSCCNSLEMHCPFNWARKLAYQAPLK
jgi:hypothetical protein